MTNLGDRSETVEFRGGKKQFDKGVKSLTAMLNSSNCGTLYFGVDETGNVIGLDLCKTAPDRIRESIATYVRPEPKVKIDVLESDDGLQYISVSATSDCAIYSFDDKYYIRDGISNAIASPEELVRLARSYGTEPLADIQPDEQIRDDLNPNLSKILKYLKKNRTAKLSDVSKKTGISLSAVKKDVSELKRRGYVDNKGTNRNSIWVVK